MAYKTLSYRRQGRIARITLDRPRRLNAISARMPGEIAAAVAEANADPKVHVIVLAGAGRAFCAGYDLVDFAEKKTRLIQSEMPWDPMRDYAVMKGFTENFMALFKSYKPTICKVHGYAVAGGSDLALCCDLVVMAEDAKIGYPPARVWGSPTTSVWAFRLGIEKAKRLLFTGDCLNGREAVEWGLASECAPADQLDARTEILLERIARMPINQLVMMKLLVNQTVLAAGLPTTQILGTLFDGIARHTAEGYAFQQRAAAAGFKQAVRERDEPFGDVGPSTFKG